jgi:hypothetical protein
MRIENNKPQIKLKLLTRRCVMNTEDVNLEINEIDLEEYFTRCETESEILRGPVVE